MDLLGTAASVLAVIKLASGVAKYITSAAGATKARKKLRDEVRACQYVLQELLDESSDLDGGESWKDTINALEAPGSPLGRLSVALHAIEAKLLANQGRGEGVRSSLGLSSLSWPFCEKDIQQILITVEREKSLLMLALENDSRKLMRQVDQTTKENQKLLLDLIDLVRESSEETDLRGTGLADAMSRVELSQTVLQENLGQLRQVEEDRHTANWRKNVLEWLTPVDYVSQQSDYINQREPGTGQWLLESREFKAWVSETKKRTLFCPGIPGAGKTILTAVAIDQLTTMFEDNSTVTIAFVYCNFRREYQQSTRDLLASLLRQVAQRNSALPVISDALQLLSDRYMQKQARPSVDMLSKTLRSIISAYSHVYVFVDALDECQTTDGCRSQFLSEILSLQKDFKVKLFTTSRWIPEIIDRFRAEDTLTVEIRAKPQDVRKYTNSRLPRLPGFVGRSPELQEEIRLGIEKAVDGMFLLAQLHLDSLIGKRSPKALRTTLARLPSGSEAYDRAYKDAMIRIESQVSDQVEIAKQALSWITCAKSPLTTAELLHALAIEAETSAFDTDSVPQLEDVVSSCAGLLTLDEESDIVRLVHYTAQEYFERTKDEWFPNMERDLASACVTYLSYDCFGGLYYFQEKDIKELCDKYPLYDYACCNWGHHVREAGLCTSEIVSFLKSSTGNAQTSARILVSNHTDSYRYWPTAPMEDGKVKPLMTGMHLAAYFGAKEAWDALFSDSTSVDQLDTCSRTPFSWAAENGHTEMVKWMLVLGANADAPDTGNQTPLSWASKRGHYEVVRLLLQEGADPDSKSESGRTPLSKAAANGHAFVVQLLVDEEKVDVNSRDEDGKTPLLRAIQNGHADVVRLLCTMGADVNIPDNTGQTPLIRASRWVGDDGCVRPLLDYGADPKVGDSNGVTALASALYFGNLEIAKILIEAGVDPDARDSFGMTPLCWAARGGHVEAVQLLLNMCSEHISDESKRKERGYWLEWAIQNATTKEVMELLQQEVDVNVIDHQKETPLHISSRTGCLTISKLLLDRGADIDARGSCDFTPLALAINTDAPVEIVRLLVERGADIEARDLYGNTALALAAENGKVEIVDFLLDAGADINPRNKTGGSPLATAIIAYQEEMAELLLERGADIDAKVGNGATVLSLAALHCSRGSSIVERIIKERPSLVSVVDNEGHSSLWCASESGSLEVVELLLRSGAGLGKSINDKDRCGMTALMAAVRWGHVDVVRLLLQHNTEIDPDLGDYYGTTPLSVATRIAPSLHCVELTKLLLGTGRVACASKDCFGRTPLWWARRARNRDVEVLLIEYNGQKDNSEVSGASIPKQIFHSERAKVDVYCDICYRSMKSATYEYTSRYKCQKCNGGDFDICEECYDAGGRCVDTTGTHCLFRAYLGTYDPQALGRGVCNN